MSEHGYMTNDETAMPPVVQEFIDNHHNPIVAAKNAEIKRLQAAAKTRLRSEGNLRLLATTEAFEEAAKIAEKCPMGATPYQIATEIRAKAKEPQAK